VSCPILPEQSQAGNRFRYILKYKSRPLISGDSGVEEVYRRRTSVTSQKVVQNVGGVSNPQPEFVNCPDTHDTHSGCVSGSGYA